MSNARLTFQSTPLSADAFFIAGMNVADPFIGMEYKGKFYAAVSALELGNFTKYSRVDELFSLEALQAKMPVGLKGSDAVAYAVKMLLRHLGARGVTVSGECGVAVFESLRKVVKVGVAKGALFPERLYKSPQHCQEITRANRGCAAAIRWVGQQIAAAKIIKGALSLNKRPLTSEALRLGAQRILLDNGLRGSGDIIIAGGAQGCDPHCIGFGKLKAGELIVVDIFAPLADSGYWGDMTRTFIKGVPTDAQAKLVKSVAKAQKEAIRSIKPGINGRAIDAVVRNGFEKEGYQTMRRSSGYVGFFHGTGHSLGLECHDLGEHGKRISKISCVLKEGEVYTVEPGLYYPEIGGCRIEDNGVVTQEGFKLLSKLGYDWIL